MTETGIVVAVVEAVAAADGHDPVEAEPLYEYVNPDALTALCKQDGGEWSLTFQYAGHQVTVDHRSQIRVDGVTYTPDASNRFD